MENKIKGGIMGVIVGDALGLPVQFLYRNEIKENPITGMRGGGAFDTPAGTWSDDSSLTLCLMLSLTECGYDLQDIAKRFIQWYNEGYLTPFNYSFDVGSATVTAIERLKAGIFPLESGPTDEHSNGNGSLMRILPAILYFAHLPELEMLKKVADISRITHGHPRSVLGCSLYALYTISLLQGKSPQEAYIALKEKSSYIFKGTSLEKEIRHYNRILDGDIGKLSEDSIKSSGYVVHTLEAAIWSLLTSHNFSETLLKAVNLGDDADTVGAVTGGMAGVYYGYSAIPSEWMNVLIKKDELIDKVDKFTSKLIT